MSPNHDHHTLTCFRWSEDLWDKALKTLNQEDLQQIDFQMLDKRALLGEILRAVDDKKRLCQDRGWKLRKRNGDVVALRSVFEKMVDWVVKFKDFGDLATQYDPVHAALPWAAVRFFLQVS